MKIALSLALLLVTLPFAALARDMVTVGRCPTQIGLHRSGIWAAATEDEAALKHLRANPARKASVEVLFATSAGASFFMEGLSSLDAAQGIIGEDDFAAIRAAAARMLPAAQHSQALQRRISELTAGGNTKVESFTTGQLVVISANAFYFTGTSQGVASNGAPVAASTAARFELIRGCVIVVTFIFPTDYDDAEIADAVVSVGLE